MTSRTTDRIHDALTWGGLALLAWLVYLDVRPFLIPLGWAAVLAIVAFPVHARLARRMKSGWAAAITTVGVTIIVIVPAVALTAAFVREALDLSDNLQSAIADGRLAIVQSVWEALLRRLPASAARVDVTTLTTDALREGAAFLVSRAGSIFQNVAEFLVDLALALFATFFLLRDHADIMHAVRRLLPMAEDQRETMIKRTRDLIWAGVL